jgi:hypothetical protein
LIVPFDGQRLGLGLSLSVSAASECECDLTPPSPKRVAFVGSWRFPSCRDLHKLLPAGVAAMVLFRCAMVSLSRAVSEVSDLVRKQVVFQFWTCIFISK